MGKMYDEKSIESLSPLEFTRLRPGVYAGDCTYSTQLLIEIFSNAVDEFNAGHGSCIDVTINKDIVTVSDEGQGFIPNSFREDGKTILEAAFSVLNTSGKYREDGSYEGTSLGSFGIGSKIVNFLSNWLKVTTFRNGIGESIFFEEGVFKSRKVEETDKNKHGTVICWKPSSEFFKHTEVEINKIKDLFKTISCLCSGLTINLDNDGEKITYFSKNGLNDLVAEAVEGKEILKNRLSINGQGGIDNKYHFNLVMTYTENYSSNIIAYVNTGLTDTGPHITQLKTALTREMNKFFREKKWIKEKDDNLSGEDIQEGLYIVFNYTAPSVAYDAQVKSRVTAIDTKYETSLFVEELQKWLAANEKEIKTIAEKATGAKKAREAAKRARDAARDNKKTKKAKIADMPTKLIDCSCTNRELAELILCEGDSAAGGLVAARDAETQAIFGLRGKMINAFKNQSEKIMANQEINNLIKALGLPLGPNGKLIYDKSKLRYSKIIAATDGDPDGENIRMLIAVNLWELCPEIILNGHFYIAYAPLFRITTNKNKYIYIKDAVALEEYKQNHIGEKYSVNRMKGLGECDAEELAPTLLEKETRNVKQVIVEDREAAEEHLIMLMGKTVAGRRQFLLENGNKANNLYEESEENDI